MTTIAPVNGGLLAALAADSDVASRRVSQLTQESATGLIAPDYAGLGDGARVSLDLAPQVARQKALQQGLTAASGPLGVAQTALQRINTLAQQAVASLDGLNNLDAQSVTSVAQSAQSALQQVAGLLDSQDGGTYVFAGQDGSNPPVPQPDNILTSGFYTTIGTAIGNLPTAGAAATAAATLTTAGSTAAGTSPFSPTLEALAAATTDGRATIETGPGQRAASVMLASRNGDVASTGGSTTGSYMRDVLRALATIGSLTQASTNASGFQALVQDTRASLNGAISAMSADAGVLGDRQTALSNQAGAIDDTLTALNSQIGDEQDADLAQVSTRLSSAQTQLQASYQLIANAKQLSLANYL